MKVTELNDVRKLFRDGMSKIVFSDENIAVLDSIDGFCDQEDYVDVNSFILLGVRGGSCVLTVNGKRYELTAGCLFICGPRNILSQTEVSEDFVAYGYLLSAEYILYIIKQVNLNAASYIMFATCMNVQLTAEEQTLFRTYHALLGSRLKRAESPMQRNLIDHLLQAAAVEMAILFEKYKLPDVTPTAYTAAEQIFQRFVELLHKHDKSIRNVNDYARALGITPKYFSFVCKRVRGKTASTIINEEMLADAKVLLQNSANSVKHVAEQLGFANQSHFGTFIRRHTGMSPQALRGKSKKSGQ